jgi:hypothetical protein
MKKQGVFLAMLVFGLTFMSCWTTGSVNEPTPFEGRWLDQASVELIGYTDLSYTFAGNTFVLRILNDQGYAVDYTAAGTFKYTKNKIRFTSGKETWTQEYTLTADEFFLKWSDPRTRGRNPANGTFIKQ